MKKALLIFTLSFPAMAGLVVSGTVTSGNDKGSLKQFFQNDNARVDFQIRAQNGSFIYRTKTGVIYWVDHTHKSYLELNKADLDRILMLVSGFAGQATGSPAFALKKDAAARKVGQWTCARYNI